MFGDLKDDTVNTECSGLEKSLPSLYTVCDLTLNSAHRKKARQRTADNTVHYSGLAAVYAQYMKCACYKSLAVLLDTHTWHQLKIYTCLEMSIYPLVSIALSLGRHLKRRGQLKHSFSGAFRRRKGFKRSVICVIFPPVQHSGCVRAMCQGMTAKRETAGEVDLADKGQTSHRKLEINGSAGYAPCARKQAHTHHQTCNAAVWRFTYLESIRKTWNIHTDKHMKRQTEAHTKWNTSTSLPLYLHSQCSSTVPLPWLVILTNGSG